MIITGYCPTCDERVEMDDVARGDTKRNPRWVVGTCRVCLRLAEGFISTRDELLRLIAEGIPCVATELGEYLRDPTVWADHPSRYSEAL